MTNFLSTPQNAGHLKTRIRMCNYLESEHFEDTVAVLGGEVFDGFGHCAGVAFPRFRRRPHKITWLHVILAMGIGPLLHVAITAATKVLYYYHARSTEKAQGPRRVEYTDLG